MSLSKPNDFAEDVFDILTRRKVTFHGCDPWYLEINPAGDMKMWFYGHRNRRPWAGGVTIHKRPDLDNALIAGDSGALAEAFEKVIDHAQVRFGNSAGHTK